MKRSPLQMRLLLLAGALWLGPRVAHATTSPATAGEARASWQFSQSEQVAFGYTDNVMLSAFAPQQSAFGQASAELLVLRTTQRGWAFSGFFQGQLKRFHVQDAEAREQSGWFGRVESRWDPLPALSLRAIASSFGENSLLDLSESAASRLVVLTRVQGRSATAKVRLALSPSLALEVSSRPSRNDYRTFSGDFAALEHTARLEWQWSRRLLVGLDWRELRRDYDDRTHYTAGGRPLRGTQLSFWQSGGDVNLTVLLDANGQRRLTFSAGQTRNRDRASGYFDYRQNRGGVLLDWRAGSWRFAFDGQYRREVYTVQTGGIGLAPPARLSAHLQAEVRVERTLSRRWSVFGTVARDDFGGNLDEFNYLANSTSCGLRFTY